ncbi:Ornithine carbamoyltransferase [Poriferisphaera corsica]|uniref:Ornithine carbamoyltransferase n=1 Tax=Poriferisphaera corsica TaxID=2528020 RepID=A0A517YSV3_9BACT|nr:ornithine carbamoyltransferase [Poriferisphaera corsica]QDU33317.1 Ornithine carbamoyltransferase [Poriferisphaera corsica]
MKHCITIADFTPEQINHILDVAIALRDQRASGRGNDPILKGQTLAMLFEKPSLRTRVSFEQAMYELGGNAIVLSNSEVGLGKRESVADVTRVLAGMVDGVAARVFEHTKLTEMADNTSMPIINMLSDYSHPCQALADIMTLIDEFGRDLAGRTLTYIGDGNNVALSLASICSKLGINFSIATPVGYELPQTEVDAILAHNPAFKFKASTSPADVVKDTDAIYTDTWVSMGQEEEKAQRLKEFDGFQINDELLAQAPDHAIVLHCLPAYRGIEITDSVMDGPRSRVFPEAHNRLHAQKGVLAVLMGNQ